LEVKNIAIKEEGVMACSNIKSRKMGHYSVVDISIEVDPLMVKIQVKNFNSKIQIKESFK
jgi:divalent metal cation (Fe/Co/Zn/Cd) transporter